MKTILVIDDNRDTLDILEAIISGMDLNVVTSPDVIPVSKIHKLNPALVILDHWLPSGYGGDYCLKIKTNPETKHIPVILMSATLDISLVAREKCADVYLDKPFEVDDLENLIKRFVPMANEPFAAKI